MDTVIETWGLYGLFVTAFLSSTLLPGGSEALLMALALKGQHDAGQLLLVATLGNTLGGMTSWGVGRLLVWRFPGTRPKKAEHRKAVERMSRWGAPLLLFSWLPVIGDPLCVAAGWLRISAWAAVVMIAIGKGIRYAVLLSAL